MSHKSPSRRSPVASGAFLTASGPLPPLPVFIRGMPSSQASSLVDASATEEMDSGAATSSRLRLLAWRRLESSCQWSDRRITHPAHAKRICIFAPLVDGVRVHHGDADPGGQSECPPAGRVPGDSHPVQRLGWSPGPQQEEGCSPAHVGRWRRQLMSAADQAGVAQERTEADGDACPRNKRVHLARCCAGLRRDHLYIASVRLYMPRRRHCTRRAAPFCCHVIVRHTARRP